MSTNLTQEDLSLAIQFLQENAVRPEDIDLNRLVGWIKNPLHKRKGFKIVETNLHETGDSNDK